MNRFQLPEIRAAANRGVAALEFALVAPFVILVMLAGADLSLFMRTVMRMDETATGVAIAVTQYDNLYDSDFATLFTASQTIAGLTTSVTGLSGTTIITGIKKSGGTQTIAWQKLSPQATSASLFGTAVGAAPVLPDTYVLPTDGEFLIAVEVFTKASTWVLSAKLMGGPGIRRSDRMRCSNRGWVRCRQSMWAPDHDCAVDHRNGVRGRGFGGGCFAVLGVGAGHGNDAWGCGQAQGQRCGCEFRMGLHRGLFTAAKVAGCIATRGHAPPEKGYAF